MSLNELGCSHSDSSLRELIQSGLWDHAWTRADREALERDWKPHMLGSATLDAALTKLVTDLSSRRESQRR